MSEEIKEKKSYYDIQLDALNSIDRLKDKKEYIKKIDFTQLIEKDSDAQTIADINKFKDFLDEGILKEVENIEHPSPEILNLLLNTNLLEEINKELDKKIVGEDEARKTIFMVANMRNVENLGKATDNLMVNAPSGTGKDHLCEAIFELIPDEEKEELIRTTPKVLAYTRNRKLKFSLREDEE